MTNTLTLAQTNDLVQSLDEVTDADAITACRLAQQDWQDRADRLRRVHRAGRILRAVRRTPGVRGTGPTRLQTIIQAVGISRQRAQAWQEVGAIASEVVEGYINKCLGAEREVTIAGLLAYRNPKSPKRRDARFKHELDVLAQWFGTEDYGRRKREATIRAAVKFAYDNLLRERSNEGRTV